MRRFVQCLVVVAGLLGCGVQGEDGRVQLIVRSASWLDAAASRAFPVAGPGNLAVTLKVTNAQAAPLSLAATHFVLGTGDGFLYRGSPATGLFPGGCSPQASVAPGATVECTVLFSVSGTAPVAQVGYEFDDRGSALVRIAANPCTSCGGLCVDLATDEEHCGACGREVDGQCQSGQPSCGQGLTACGGKCVNLLTDAEHCGACGRRVDGARCVGGAPACDLPATLCGGECTWTNDDPLNCGRCGAACPSSYACIAGQCSCAPGQAVCGAGCVDLKRDEQNCGACGKTCSSGQVCVDGACTWSSGGSGGGGGSGGCSVNCSQFGLSCCGSSCC